MADRIEMDKMSELASKITDGRFAPTDYDYKTDPRVRIEK